LTLIIAKDFLKQALTSQQHQLSNVKKKLNF